LCFGFPNIPYPLQSPVVPQYPIGDTYQKKNINASKKNIQHASKKKIYASKKKYPGATV